MTCQKCNGLLISERILEFYAHAERWKCITCSSIKRDRRTVRRTRVNRLYGFVRESFAILICREYSEWSPVDPPVPDSPQGVKTASVHFEAEEASLLPEASRLTFRR